MDPGQIGQKPGSSRANLAQNLKAEKHRSTRYVRPDALRCRRDVVEPSFARSALAPTPGQSCGPFSCGHFG